MIDLKKYSKHNGLQRLTKISCIAEQHFSPMPHYRGQIVVYENDKLLWRENCTPMRVYESDAREDALRHAKELQELSNSVKLSIAQPSEV